MYVLSFVIPPSCHLLRHSGWSVATLPESVAVLATPKKTTLIAHPHKLHRGSLWGVSYFFKNSEPQEASPSAEIPPKNW